MLIETPEFFQNVHLSRSGTFVSETEHLEHATKLLNKLECLKCIDSSTIQKLGSWADVHAQLRIPVPLFRGCVCCRDVGRFQRLSSYVWILNYSMRVRIFEIFFKKERIRSGAHFSHHKNPNLCYYSRTIAILYVDVVLLENSKCRVSGTFF